MYRMFDDCKEEGVILTVDENYTLRKFTFKEVCDLLVKGECCIEGIDFLNKKHKQSYLDGNRSIDLWYFLRIMGDSEFGTDVCDGYVVLDSASKIYHLMKGSKCFDDIAWYAKKYELSVWCSGYLYDIEFIDSNILGINGIENRVEDFKLADTGYFIYREDNQYFVHLYNGMRLKFESDRIVLLDEYEKVRLEQVGIPCSSSYFKRNVLF